MDKLMQQAMEKHKIVRYQQSFIDVMTTYKFLLEAENQALHKPVVSGKRPTVEDFFRQSYPESSKWDKFDFEMVRFDAGSLMDFAERYASQAACASGAVEKDVSEARECRAEAFSFCTYPKCECPSTTHRAGSAGSLLS